MPDPFSKMGEMSPEKAELLRRILQKKGIVVNQAPPVTRRRSDAPCRLSFAQQRLWLLDQLEPENPFYNIPAALRLRGSLNAGALSETFDEIVRRHEALRTNFVEREGVPVQIVTPPERVPFKLIDLRPLGETERETEMLRLAEAEAHLPFNLSTDRLLRVSLLRLADDDHVLLVTMHHIVSDGWSVGVLLRELKSLYEAFTSGRPSSLAGLPVQYTDFAEWQREWLQGETLETQLSYWTKQLDGDLPFLNLPFSRPRPPKLTHRGARERLTLPSSLSRSLERLSQQEGTTLFMTLLAAFQTLLFRYTGQTDIVVGSPIANRSRVEIESLIGFFVNTLVLRSELSDSLTFRELLARVREVAKGAYAHQDVPFEVLVEKLNPERNGSYTPFFQVMFALNNAPLPALDLPGLTLSSIEINNTTAKFDLNLTIDQQGELLTAVVEYNTDLFDAVSMRRMLEHFRVLLEGVVTDPDRKLGLLPIISIAERRTLLDAWRGAGQVYDHKHLLHHLFEQHTSSSPDASAISFDHQHLSYRELNRRANRLAHRLLALGTRPDSLVGICLERSPLMIVALLGVLKAGGAYLPLDPAYPRERLSFILDDAQPLVLLTTSDLSERLPEHSAHLVYLDDDEAFRTQSDENTAVEASPENLAYVIYTSGSTGKPKGALVTHANVSRLLDATREWFHFNSQDVWTLFHSYAFDFSVWELWGALAYGGRLVIVPYFVSRSPEEFYRLLVEERVTVLNQTPSAFRQLMTVEESRSSAAAGAAAGVEELSLRYVIFGGEALELQSLRGWYERHADERPQLVNMYGITETTVHVTYRRLTAGDVRSGAGSRIGVAIPDLQLYVLDGHMEVVPEGVAGELYVGGAGLARGYLKRAKLTAERFVPDPFSSSGGGRLYRTGDVARYLAEGEYEYLGRIDQQVKVRGFRIELGEIEAALAAHEEVRECVVEAREEEGRGGGGKRLVGYVVVGGGRAVKVEELRSYMQGRVPEYMVPSAFMLLDKLPLTPNGKVDRRALPAPELEASSTSRDKAAARTPVEELLAALWAEVLRLSEVDVHESFFDLGGHSLLATQLISRVREAFAVEVPLRKLFEQPTISALAAHIEQLLKRSEGTSAPPLVRASRAGHLPLSFAQQRLWFIDQLEPQTPFYNIPVAVKLSGVLDVGALERTFSEVVRRHEVLRTSFAVTNGEPVQVIRSSMALELPLIDLSGMDEAQREARLRELAEEEVRRGFDLAAAPLLRTKLVRLGEVEHVLLLTMHHIVSDGWSIGVLIREVAALYEAYSEGQPSPLAELPVQYADYAVWQREWLQGDALEEQLSYWRKQLDGKLPVLELPADRPRPAVQSYRGRTITSAVRPQVVEAVRELSRREGVTLFMTLLAAFQVLLHHYTQQDDIIVGSPIAGRTRKEIEPLIGFFVNTLALRTRVAGDPTFDQLLRRVREVTLSAYAHQDVPFEKLVEELQPERSLSHSPVFQVMFALQNAPSERLELPHLRLASMAEGDGTAKFDLTLMAVESEGGLKLSWNYSTDLFDEATVKRMARHFEQVVEAVAASPTQRVSEIELLSAEERHRLVVELNETGSHYGPERCIHELFEAQVAETPDAVALVHGRERLTYGELNARANRLAHHLRERGVGAESLVGVLVERTAEMVVALLGVLKAGGAYVPLDAAYPQERLLFMVEDTRMRVLLAHRHLVEKLPEASCEVIEVDGEWERIARHSAENPPRVSGGENLAYIIYTSGSTGKPKGVAIEHHSAVTLLRWARTVFSPEALAGVLASTSISFDLSVFELFVPLSCGGGIILVQNALELASVEETAQVRLLNTVPSAAAELVRSGGIPRSVKVVNLAGEALSRSLVEQLYEGERIEGVYNLYGPSEDTTYSTYALMKRGERGAPSIGRPVGQTQVYVLDRRQRLVAQGVVGELYIGGEGLARGYLKRAELTAERFVPEPFSGRVGARMYRTGDVVRYGGDGRLEYLGRLDHQVKVRGFRIELGEIEAALLRHERVREAVVIARGEGADKRLAAYIVVDEGAGVENGELREQVRKRLPEYMVPHSFTRLEKLPLTPNGKVDRKALPAPDAGEGREAEQQMWPRTPTEEVVAGIWSEVLGVERVGVRENFFELGGHSLLAVQVVVRIRDLFHVELPLRAIFESPTVAELSLFINEAQHAGRSEQIPSLRPMPSDRELPLSYSQALMWYMLDRWQQSHPGPIKILLFPEAVRFKGPLNIAALERTLNELLRRHDSLRTTFSTVNGQRMQNVAPYEHAPLSIVDLSDVPDQTREQLAYRLALEEARRPVDLVNGPMFRAMLLRLGEDDHALLVTMHHIVGDGWSRGVLLREFGTLYRAFAGGQPSPLPPLPVQYSDYTLWQREWLEGATMESLLSFWTKHLEDVPRVLNLPTDFPRPEYQSFRASGRTFQFSKELSQKVNALRGQERSSMFMTLLAGFGALLSRFCNQEKLIIGTQVAGRDRSELELMIGNFLNNLLMRIDLSGDPSFRELLRRTRDFTLDAFAHQHLPFVKLLRVLKPEPDLSRPELIQVLFVFQNTPMSVQELPGLEFTFLKTGTGSATRDITLTMSEDGGVLKGTMTYDAALFKPETIARLISNFEQLLTQAVATPDVPLSTLTVFDVG